MMRIKTLQIITLLVWFVYPISIRADSVKGISDFDGSFKGVERIDFECPPNNLRKIKKPNEEEDYQKSPKSCWVDFHPSYLNVMDMQVINRNDVITFYVSPPSSGKCCASWNLIYRDSEGSTKILTIRRNVLPFPLTKRKLKRLGTPSNIIYRWLVHNHGSTTTIKN